MRRRHWTTSALLVTVGGLGAWGYYSQADAFLPTESAGNDATSFAVTDKQVKAHFDFKSAGIISDFKRCHWTDCLSEPVRDGLLPSLDGSWRQGRSRDQKALGLGENDDLEAYCKEYEGVALSSGMVFLKRR